MDFEFDRGAKKLKAEQEKRKRDAAKKRQQEASAKERYAQEQAKKKIVADAQRAQRELEAARQEEVRLAEEALTGGVTFKRSLYACRRSGIGDGVLLPGSALTELDAQPNVQFPMLFQLTCSETGRQTTCRVVEFTSNENEIQIPDELWNLLMTREDGTMVEASQYLKVDVKYITMPKGTYAVLQPLSAAFRDIPNHKAGLENTLNKHYAILNLDQVVHVVHNKMAFPCRVRELKPAESVQIIETDLMVDIVDPPEDGSARAPIALAQLCPGLVNEADAGTQDPMDIVEKNDTGLGGGQSTVSERSGEVIDTVEIGGEAVGSVLATHYKFYKVNVPSQTADAILSGKQSLDITASVITPQPRSGAGTSASHGGGSHSDTQADVGDVNVYVSASPVLRPTWIDHSLAAYADIGSNTLRLNGDHLRELNAVTLYVSVEGWTSGTAAAHMEFKLTLALADVSTEADTAAAGSSDQSKVPEGMSLCSNCHQHVPSHNMDRHQLFCLRHNTVCSHAGCGKVLRAAEKDQHTHCPVESCGLGMDTMQLAKHTAMIHSCVRCSCAHESTSLTAHLSHRRTECPDRMIVCRFCQDVVHAGAAPSDVALRMRGLTGHESMCGSRTAECDICHRFVTLKDMEMHMAAVHSSPSIAGTSGPPQQSALATVAVEAALQCPICGHGVRSEIALNRHLDSNECQTVASTPKQPTPPANTTPQPPAVVVPPPPAHVTPVPMDETPHSGDGDPMEVESRTQEGQGAAAETDKSHLVVPGSATPMVECPICMSPLRNERALNEHLDTVHC
eukprot:GFYU01002543.1.p1 GENE.GFYU01002543.1~~GFYU01002543.1.p1  ORF type:complete len:793 (-),score=173.41 GFYU01002543.1:59-2437(-)